MRGFELSRETACNFQAVRHFQRKERETTLRYRHGLLHPLSNATAIAIAKYMRHRRRPPRRVYNERGTHLYVVCLRHWSIRINK